jgi:hypothetical protein
MIWNRKQHHTRSPQQSVHRSAVYMFVEAMRQFPAKKLALQKSFVLQVAAYTAVSALRLMHIWWTRSFLSVDISNRTVLDYYSLLSRVRSVYEWVFWWWKIRLRDFDGCMLLEVPLTRLYLKRCFCYAVYIDVYMEVRLSSAWTVERILLMFDVQKFICYRLVPDEYEHSSSKKSPSNGTQTQNGTFF